MMDLSTFVFENERLDLVIGRSITATSGKLHASQQLQRRVHLIRLSLGAGQVCAYRI